MTDFFTAVLARTEHRRPALTRRPMSTFETPRSPQLRLIADPPSASLEETTVRVAVPPPLRTQPSAVVTPDDPPLVPEPSRRVQPRRSRQDVEEEAPVEIRPKRTESVGSVGVAAPPRPEPVDSPSEPGIETRQVVSVRTVERATQVRGGLETIVETPAPEPVERPAPQAEPVPQVTVARVEAVPVERPRRIDPVARPDEPAPRPVRERPFQPLRRQRPPTVANRVVPPTPPPPPAVHVTIGRIEVRATPSRPVPQKPAPKPAAPKLGLDEYLRSRNGRAG